MPDGPDRVAEDSMSEVDDSSLRRELRSSSDVDEDAMAVAGADFRRGVAFDFVDFVAVGWGGLKEGRPRFTDAFEDEGGILGVLRFLWRVAVIRSSGYLHG